MNVQWDKEQLAKTFVEVYKLTFPVGRDASGEIGALYQVEGLRADPRREMHTRGG